jgi:hypothetical protein
MEMRNVLGLFLGVLLFIMALVFYVIFAMQI